MHIRMHETNIIRLIVGPEHKVYQVHKDRLFVKIPSFLNLISKNQEHAEGTEFRTNGTNNFNSEGRLMGVKIERSRCPDEETYILCILLYP